MTEALIASSDTRRGRDAAMGGARGTTFSLENTVPSLVACGQALFGRMRLTASSSFPTNSETGGGFGGIRLMRAHKVVDRFSLSIEVASLQTALVEGFPHRLDFFVCADCVSASPSFRSCGLLVYHLITLGTSPSFHRLVCCYHILSMASVSDKSTSMFSKTPSTYQ